MASVRPRLEIVPSIRECQGASAAREGHCELGTGECSWAEWDRATRSMLDGVAIIERIHARGCFVKVLDKPHLDLTTPLGRGLIALLSAMAEDERQRIVKRARDGLDAAGERGARKLPAACFESRTLGLRAIQTVLGIWV